MSFFSDRKVFFTILLCILVIPEILNGQAYRFTNYGVDSKIPSTFIYTIDQSSNGYLWIGTANGISRFDGFDFHNIVYPDSVAERYPNTSLKDKNEILWFGCNDGTVFYTSEDKLIQLNFDNKQSISDLVEGPDGYIYIFPQGGAVHRVNPLKPDDLESYNVDRSIVILSGCLTTEGKILIGTQENLLVCTITNDSIAIQDIIEGFDYSPVTAIHQFAGSEKFAIGTDGNGLFRLSLSPAGNILSRFTDPGLELLRIQSVFEDIDSSLWISTFETGMFQVWTDGEGNVTESLHFDKNSGLAGNDVKLVYQDLEGNLWISLFGDGLSLLSSYAFSYFKPGNTPETNDIISIGKTGSDYFLGTPTGFFLFDLDNYKTRQFVTLFNKTGNIGIASYYVENENTVWVGTKGNGLFLTNKEGSVTKIFSSGDPGKDHIMDVVIDGGNIWMATLNGVIVLDKRTRRVVHTYSIDNGLPHNSINQIILSDNGDALIALESDRLYKITPNAGISVAEEKMSGNYINKVTSIAKGKDEVIWVATSGNGIFECYEDSIIPIDRAKGLLSNFCYSILVDSENRVWTGHERGFSRYDPATGIMKVFAHSGDCNQQGMYESPDGKIFIGTKDGLIIYDTKKDRKQNIAPFTNINYVSINDVIYPYMPSYSLPYRKRYAIKVGYVGIQFSDPEKVYYSTMLENYDNDWTRLSSSREIPYSLSDGKYRYHVVSVNEEGLTQDMPASFEISIKRPVWRTWWGIMLSFGFVFGIILTIIREREKAQKKVQEYLEKELDARTRIVMKQKGEIEMQNLEITDSINYAKRIQTSILPDINKLRETFKDAFILFQPRDIVSGDFYWFDKIDDEKFVLVCADSTGHGVPGAFMSMIGSTLLHDIVTRQKITKPSEILKLLDKQIFATLNQNDELGVSNDGMDIVVCEFNTKTNYMRFASAMRPVIIVMDGAPFYITGNRSSVGGETVIEKYYDDQEYYLKEGDIIYLFSDGLPDQFGGKDGKKMKIVRLKKLVENIVKLPMEEQRDIIFKFYQDWKGDLDQVDDVLIMGVRI